MVIAVRVRKQPFGMVADRLILLGDDFDPAGERPRASVGVSDADDLALRSERCGMSVRRRGVVIHDGIILFSYPRPTNRASVIGLS